MFRSNVEAATRKAALFITKLTQRILAQNTTVSSFKGMDISNIKTNVRKINRNI